MPRTFTDEEYEAEVKRLTDIAVADAIKAGKVINKEDADKQMAAMFTEEQVKERVEKEVRTRQRKAAVAALPFDDATKAEFEVIALSDKFAMTDDGDKAFKEAMERWGKLKAVASAPPEGDKKPFSPDSNNGDIQVLEVERIY